MHLFDTSIVILLCYGLVTSTRLVSADGSIGCLFRKSLCEPKFEWCFDDYAFGRCVPRGGDVDFYQYQLNGDSLFLLRGELERLLNLGYRWSDYYTQCVFKAVLSAFRYQREYDESLCDAYSIHRQRSALPYIQRNMEVDPENVGQVVFTPSVVDPHSDFADEIYFPGLKGRNPLDESMLSGRVRPKHENDQFDDLREALLMTEMNENKRSKYGRPIDMTHPNDIDDEDVPNYMSYLSKIVNEDASRNSPYAGYVEDPDKYNFAGSYNPPDHYRPHLESKNYDKDVEFLENVIANDENLLKSFSKNYNTPDKLKNGHEAKDEVLYPKNDDERSYQMNDDFFPEGRQFIYDNYNGFKNGFEKSVKNEKDDGGVFTEGGLVHLKDENKDESINSNSIEDIMKSFENMGFKRPERLDVKKPGPSFSTNNFAFRIGKEDGKDNKDKGSSESSQVKSAGKPSYGLETPKNIIAQPEKKKVGSPMESPSLRRHTTTTTRPSSKDKDADEEEEDYDDLQEYAYIKLKNRVNTWQEASKIVRKLEDILRLSQNTFFNIRVDQNEVKFKVKPNHYHLSASEVIKRIDANKNLIQRAIGQEVLSSGVGDQNKPPTSMSLIDEDERQLWILSFLLCGVIAAAAIAGAALFVFRRHSHNKEKLQNLSQMDSEASKDYQELCRARMASKSSQEKPEGGISGHRVTNLAKETEGSNHSPSSRSSTSSWSEEPALTNMDISTGHMVLSYMEDHLKNKDRLEQEWIALCAYEAEPCATNIAMKEENMKKNRYNDVLPYDHARVVLNELSNISGSDYINASTITDHDPRNPAYIASQGPLPNTAADFWQMIWEQGSVVMVMLTRLTENGTAMCHRYWPEEGSELYHIYEVHLVSEHIWCDDYLVRSFYLKNLKTGETRTVTQFHFLSWPENGIPLSTKALLEFRRKVNKSYRGRSCPIIVHCSDGVGRTGTYCLIDMVLNRMSKGAKEIDIAATLEHIRDQRPLMVRTKQQFEFVLMAVAEEVHAILKALPANPNHSPPPVLKEKEEILK